MSAAGQAPDIAFVSAAWIQDFARLGIAFNLDPFVEKTGVFGPEDADKYFLNTLDGLRYPGTKGSLYASPLRVGHDCLLLSTKTSLTRPGSPIPPTTGPTRTCCEAAQRLTKTRATRSNSMALFRTGTIDSSIRRLHANGGSILIEDYKRPYLTPEKNIDTVQWWVDLIQKDKVAPLPAEFTEGGPTTFFTSGKVAMAILGVWAIQDLPRDGPIQLGYRHVAQRQEKQTAVQWPNHTPSPSRPRTGRGVQFCHVLPFAPTAPPTPSALARCPS